MYPKWLITSLILAFAGAPIAGLADASHDIAELRSQIEQLKNQYEQRIRMLEARLQAAERADQNAHRGQSRPQETETGSALERAVAELEPSEREARAAPRGQDLFSRRIGGAEARLMDISLITNLAAGWSSADDDTIRELQGGEHDPRRRGFTLQQAELGIHGAVDPYFTASAFILFSEDEIELEEAFFTTLALPYNLQLKGGFFLTEFGRINPRHLHEWDWLDQPFINTRLFSGDGSRASGLRLGWLLPTPWFSEFLVGVQDPTNDTMISFLGEGHAHGDHGHGNEGYDHHDHDNNHNHNNHNNDNFEEGIGGFARVKDSIDKPADLVYLLRWVNGGDLTPQVSAQLGLSALFGPNFTGNEGDTIIYGADLVMKWRPIGHFRGWPFVTWESEIMKRDFKVDRNNPAFGDEDTLRDWGLYTQVLYGFTYPWSAGLRFEYASGSGEGPDARDRDPLRSDRYRLSPLLAWQPTEFSRILLQYNYDKADFLQDDEHSVWLGVEVTLGAHPPHRY